MHAIVDLLKLLSAEIQELSETFAPFTLIATGQDLLKRFAEWRRPLRASTKSFDSLAKSCVRSWNHTIVLRSDQPPVRNPPTHELFTAAALKADFFFGALLSDFNRLR